MPFLITMVNVLTLHDSLKSLLSPKRKTDCEVSSKLITQEETRKMKNNNKPIVYGIILLNILRV